MDLVKKLSDRRLILALLLVGLMLYTPLISGSLDSLGMFKQNQDVRIVQVCSDATYINITSISYPNSSQAVSNVAMELNGGDFFYVFEDTSDIGRYDVRGISDGCEKTFATYFEISRMGTSTSTGQGIIYIFSATLVFVLFLLTLYFAISIPWANQTRSDGSILAIDYKKYLKFVMAFVSYLILMFFMFIGKGMSYSFLDSTELYGFFNIASSIMVIAIAPVLIVSVVFLIFSILTDKKISRAIERGIPIR